MTSIARLSRRAAAGAPRSVPSTHARERPVGLSRRVDNLHRSVLEPGVLRGLLPLRVDAVRHRATEPAAREREARLRQVSSTYEALAYVTQVRGGRTDIVAFNLAPAGP